MEDNDMMLSTKVWESLYQKLATHLFEIDDRIFADRENLLSAYRYTEIIRMFNSFITLRNHFYYCIIFRELRFCLESFVQSLYIDTNHLEANLDTKLEIYKALCNMKGFIGQQLFDKAEIDGKLKKRLKMIYKELSNYVHGSLIEIQDTVTRHINEAVRFQENQSQERMCFQKSKEIMNLILEISREFEERYIEIKYPS